MDLIVKNTLKADYRLKLYCFSNDPNFFYKKQSLNVKEYTYSILQLYDLNQLNKFNYSLMIIRINILLLN